MSEVLLSPNESVTFWRPQDVVDLGFAIPILVKSGIDQRGKWPSGTFPSWGEIHSELGASRSAFLKVKKNREKGLTYINLLTGRFVIFATCSVSNKNGQLWVWLNKVGIEYASNRQRCEFARQGVHIMHEGIFFVSPDVFRTRFEERGSVYRSRTYLYRLMDACNQDIDDEDDGGYLAGC